ncbi:tRNA (adenosine(37)-N6)-threonylcarbamoyltransferase complex dimerization subunit type 1 TsaB [Desulfurivibrio sp. D14AmB]|uniref:tRNA (adenosine(37)-N6)-threonylcarbamoyltransferase complex dimerization subunit type 1 TsaB n=1 Tax=Desulfurivibrio sp. D14AmB TaxID=3374370 RepID=UPI00376F043F
MPILLALETSGSCGSVALVDETGCRAEHSLQSSRTHSRRLLEAVARLLAEDGVTWPELDGIAVGLGPGSFTGLRIGLSSAKGLALATGKPLLGISSLDALADQVLPSPYPICALIDARKQEVFAGFYDGGDQLQRLEEYLAIPPTDLVDRITTPTLLIGSGAQLYRPLLQEKLGSLAHFASPALFFPRAAAIGHLALAAWQQQQFLDPGRAVPLYIRPSDAQLPSTRP